MIIIAIVTMVLVGLTIIGHFALKNHLATSPEPVSTSATKQPQATRPRPPRSTTQSTPSTARETRVHSQKPSEDTAEQNLCQAMDYPPLDDSVPEYLEIDEDDMYGPTFAPDGTGNDEDI